MVIREFVQFLSVAKGSAGEVRAQLYVALDAGYINKDKFHEIYKLTDEVSRLLAGLIRYLSKTELKGYKFR